MLRFIAALESGAPLETGYFLGGGTDASSFWPDMLVAALSTGLIALLVLWAERRISNRAARRAAFNAQSHVVEQAALLLDREFAYRYRELAPDTKSLRKLRKLVRRVPADSPLRPVRGYRYAAAVANADVALRIRIEAIKAHAARYATRPGAQTHFVEGLFIDHAKRIATHDAAPRVWVRRGQEDILSPALWAEVESDGVLAEDLNSYVLQRRLMHANREAFFITYSRWRADEWAASIAAVKDEPKWPKTWCRELKRRSDVAEAKRKGEADAAALVAGINPYEGYP